MNVEAIISGLIGIIIGQVVGQTIGWVSAKNIAEGNRKTQRLIELDKFRRDTRNQATQPIVDIVRARIVRYTSIIADIWSYIEDDSTVVKSWTDLVKELGEMLEGSVHARLLTRAIFGLNKQVEDLMDLDDRVRGGISGLIGMLIEEEVSKDKVKSAYDSVENDLVFLNLEFMKFVSQVVEKYVYE